MCLEGLRQTKVRELSPRLPPLAPQAPAHPSGQPARAKADVCSGPAPSHGARAWPALPGHAAVFSEHQGALAQEARSWYLDRLGSVP